MSQLPNMSKYAVVDDSYNRSSNSTNSTSDDNYFGYMYLETHYGWMVLTALVIGVAAVIGTFGNILIILAVTFVKTLRTCGNVFVLNLSLADLVVTVFIDPFNVVGAVAGRKYLISNQGLCDWVAAFCAPACMSSMWNMCAISLNRYVLICKPHLYQRIFTFPKTILYCVFIWVLAHLLHMPNHFGWGRKRFNKDYYLCSFDIVLHSYAVFYVVTGVLIPLVGVLFGYTMIFLKVSGVRSQLRQHRKSVLVAPATAENIVSTKRIKKRRPKNPGYSQDDVQLAKTLFAAFVIFLICWLPFALFVLAHQPEQIPGWLYVVAIIMAHGNSAVNPILYGATNEKFRDGYRQVLGGKSKVEPLRTGTVNFRVASSSRDRRIDSFTQGYTNDSQNEQVTFNSSALAKERR